MTEVPLIRPLPPLFRVIGVILVLFIILFFLIYFIHPYMNHRGRQINGRLLLPDLMHTEISSKTLQVVQIVHHWMTVFLTYGFFLYFLFVNYPTVLYYLIVLLSLKIILRLFHVATLLPDSKNGDCHYTTHLFEMMRHSGSCNNLGVSGHLISVGLAVYLISLYQDHRFAWLWIGVYIGLFFTTTVSRNHYTLDCLTSTVLLLLVISQTERIQHWIQRLTGMHLELKKK